MLPPPPPLLTYYVLLGLSHPLSEAQLPSLEHGAKAILSFLTTVRVLEQNQTFKKELLVWPLGLGLCRCWGHRGLSPRMGLYSGSTQPSLFCFQEEVTNAWSIYSIGREGYLCFDHSTYNQTSQRCCKHPECSGTEIQAG